MNFAWVRPLIRKSSHFVVKHSPEILMGMGTAGLTTSVIFAAQASPKALELLKKAEEEKGSKLTFWEKVRACGKVYIPTTGMTLFSLSCFWTSHGINMKRNAILTGLYSTAEQALQEYQKKTMELLGEKDEKEIRQSINQDKVNRLPAPPVSSTPPGTTDRWCLLNPDDVNGGTYFMSNYIRIKESENLANHEMIQNMYISETELMWLLDPEKRWLKPKRHSGDIGWSVDKLLVLEVTECDGPEHQPIYVIQYKDKDGFDYFPQAGFSTLH